LQDEKAANEQGNNRISIITASKSPGEDQSIEVISERDQRFFTTKGNQYHLIYKGKGSMYRENKGSGNIEDIVYKGSHKTTAEKNITRVAAKGSIIEQATKGDINYTAKEGSIAIEAAQEISLTVGGSTVVIDNTGVTITAPTINLVGPVVVSSGTTTLSTGVVLDTHTHPGVKSGTSSTLGPQ
jgi:type VI secretion system secreted protein VgrG